MTVAEIKKKIKTKGCGIKLRNIANSAKSKPLLHFKIINTHVKTISNMFDNTPP